MKKFLIILSLFLSYFTYSQDKSNYYAVVNSFKSDTKGKIIVYINNKETELNTGSKIEAGNTLITFDEQNIELLIYKDNKIISAAYIKENSDFSFGFDEKSNSQNFRMRFGGVRIVSDSDILTKLVSQKVTISFNKADFGFVSLIDFEKNINKGQVIIFDGTLNFKAGSKEVKIENFQNAFFEDEELFEAKASFLSELKSWKEKSIFHISEFPKNLTFFLETHNLDELPEKTKKLLASENKAIEKGKKKNSFAGLVSFELGGITYNKLYGVRAVYNPYITFFNEDLKFGLYFPFNILPRTLFNGDIFFKVNNKNNEWSFGTDKETVEEKVFDIFDDVLLKINEADYAYKDIFTLNSGNCFNVSDYLDNALVNYNSEIFYPMYRKSSFAFNLNFPWLKAFFYAEDVLPKGLYGTSLSLMTPFKSFKARLDISLFLDCYNMMQFENRESLIPLQLSSTLNFDIFNLPSFGFSFYFSGGVLFPLSYNYYNGTSLSESLFSKYSSAAIGANTMGSVGFLFRAKKTSFYGEFIYDSGLNKIGLFDSYYLGVRDGKYDQMYEWMLDINERSTNVYDHNFGGRIRIKYNFTKYVDVETSYQITGPKYYDKLYIKTSFDTHDKFKLRFVIYSEWVMSGIVQSAMNFERLLLNNVFYVGYKQIFMPGFDFNFALGIFPDYIYYDTFPHKSKMSIDFFITIAPLVMSSNFKKNNK